MHLFSVRLVCGDHCVMEKGNPTAGIVFANCSVPAPCFSEALVVLLAVPVKGFT